MKQDFELKVQAWLDGELSGPEARRVSQEVDGDAAAALLAAELRFIKTAIAGNETLAALPETREFYWSKIQRQIEGEDRARRPEEIPDRKGWLRWLSPLAGVAALGCMMLLAVRPPAPAAFDEFSSTGEGMEAVTFHDQSAGMTVVWLADSEQAQQQIDAPAAKAPEAGDGEGEME